MNNESTVDLSQAPAVADNNPAQESADSVVLEEEIDPNYVPSESEVIEYAKWLGMDLDTDKNLFWIAREGLLAPLPKDWKPCRTKDTDDIYYFNFSTGESTWDHPCDGYYKRLYEEEKKKKEIEMKESNDQKRSKAKQDVEQLLGKTEKKKKKKRVADIPSPLRNSGESLGSLDKAPLPSLLQRNPLPNIRLSGSTNSLSQSDNDGDTIPLPIAKKKMPSPLTVAEDKIDTSQGASRDSSRREEKIDAKPALPKKNVQGEETNDAKYSSDARMPTKKSASPMHTANQVRVELNRPRSRSSSPVSALRGEVAASSIYHVDDTATNAEEKNVGESKDDDKKDTDKELLQKSRNNVKSPVPEGIASMWEANRNPAGNVQYPNGSEQHSLNSIADLEKLKELQMEAETLRNESSSMRRELKDLEAKNSSLRAALSDAKSEIKVWEDRFDCNHEDWKAKMAEARAAQDLLDNERRQLKLKLLDLESKYSSSQSTTSDGKETEDNTAVDLMNQRLKNEVATLKEKLSLSEMELRKSREDADKQADDVFKMSERCKELENIRDTLEGKVIAAEKMKEELQESAETNEVSKLKSERDDLRRELRALNEKLSEAQERHELKTSSMTSLELSMQRRYDILLTENKSIVEKLDAVTRQERVSATNLDLAVKDLEASKKQCKEMSGKISLLEEEASKAALKEKTLNQEVAQLSAELSETKVQLSNYMQDKPLMIDEDAASSKVRQYEQKINDMQQKVNDLGTEKVMLLGQLSRKSTELQHAKEELNSIADQSEMRRQLEQENKLLSEERNTIVSDLRTQQQAEVDLRNNYESLVKELEEEREKLRAIQASCNDLERTIEEERTSNSQKDKKIRSYQEELIQLQKRVTELNQSSIVSKDAVASAAEKDYSLSRLQLDLEAKVHEVTLLTEQVEALKSSCTTHLATISSLQSDNMQLKSSLKSSELALERNTLAGVAAAADDGSKEEKLKQSLSELKSEINEMRMQKANLELELHDAGQKKSNLESAIETAQLITERLREENATLKAKWMAAENKTLELSLQNSRSSSDKDLQLESLRGQLVSSEKTQEELRNALNSVHDGKLAAEKECNQLRCERDKSALALKELQQDVVLRREMNSKVGDDLNDYYVRVQHELKEAKMKNKLLEEKIIEMQRDIGLVETSRKAKEPFSSMNINEAPQVGDPQLLQKDLPTPTVHDAIIGGLSLAGLHGGGSSHIVELSILVGRQQGAMIRLEEQLRAAEARILTISSKNDIIKNKARDNPAAENVTSSPDSQICLKAHEGHISDSSLTYGSELRRKRVRQNSSRSVKFKRSKDEMDGLESITLPLEQRVSDAIVKSELSEKVKALNVASVSAGDMRAINARQRAISDLKNRLKRETRLLRELQQICSSSKRTIKSDQACIRSMKTMWKNRGSSSAISAHQINSTTNKLNKQVDLLRSLNSFIGLRQRKLNGLEQSMEYLEMLTESDRSKASDKAEGLKFVEEEAGDTRKRIEELCHTIGSKGDNLTSELQAFLMSVRNVDCPEDRALQFEGTSATSTNTHEVRDILSGSDSGKAASVPDGMNVHSTGLYPNRESIQVYQQPRLNIPNTLLGPSTEYFAIEPRHKSQILQDQINKYMDKHSYSKQICDKHAG